MRSLNLKQRTTVLVARTCGQRPVLALGTHPRKPRPAPVRVIGIPLVGGAAPDVDGGGVSQGVHGTPFSVGDGFVPSPHHCTFLAMSPALGGVLQNSELVSILNLPDVETSI